jgi:chromosome segregation ATPase
MPIFRRKKEEVTPKSTELEEVKKAVEGEKPEVEAEPEKLPPEPETYAPLFVKIERYKEVLNLLSEIKTTIVTLKNAFSVINELEKLRSETMKTIQASLNRVDTKVLSLDREFLRPKGYEEELPEHFEPEVENLSVIVEDLKSQVEKLKSKIKE